LEVKGQKIKGKRVVFCGGKLIYNGLTPAYGVAGAGSKICLKKRLYFCLKSEYNFEERKNAWEVLSCFVKNMLRVW